MEETLIKLVMIMLWGLLLLFTAAPASGFVPLHTGGVRQAPLVVPEFQVAFAPPTIRLRATKDDDEEEEEKKENPYADPNYPDLEFVNYDDPEYQVDQGQGDEFYDPDSTEAQIEEMREDRRRRNDECKLWMNQ